MLIKTRVNDTTENGRQTATDQFEERESMVKFMVTASSEVT